MNSRNGDRAGDNGWPAIGPGTADPQIIEFGSFRIDCSARRLLAGGRRIRIQQKPLDVLMYLARHHLRVVTREELLARFWPRVVNEEALTRCISTIRRLLGDTREPPRFIETQWALGYRFIAPVSLKTSQVMETKTEAPARSNHKGTWHPSSWPVIAATVMILFVAGIGARDVAERPARETIRTLIVLPIAAGPEVDNWFVESLSDHLVQTVSRIEGLTVLARGSAMQFTASSDPMQIGARLRVDAALVTHLDSVGDANALRAQLVSTRDGRVLWSFRVDPALHGIEDEQIRQLARSVARRLWAALQLGKADRAVDQRAYDFYLRGRYYWKQRSTVALATAIQAFESALDIEPEYVDAWLGLADSWLVMPNYSAMPPKDAVPRARAAAETALALDPSAAHGLAVLGVIAMQHDWDWTSAEDYLRRALTLNPNDETTEQWLGEFYCYRLRQTECRKHLLAAAGLDPLSPVLRMMQGSPDLFAGDFGAAVAAYSLALEEVPEFPFARYVLGLGHAGLGDWDNAIASYETSLPHLGLAIVGGPLAYALARNGDSSKAETMLAQLEALTESQYVPPTKIAIAWLGLGDRQRALEWIGRALEARDDRLVYLGVDAHFLELHSDPDFRAYAERIGVLDVLQARLHESPPAPSPSYLP